MTPPVVVSVGVFDGFHLGHASVVAQASRRAGAAAARLVAFTFDPHPDAIFLPDHRDTRLTLPGERTALLRQAGVDEIRVLGFSKHMAAKGPRRFFVEHVFPFYRVTRVVVGYDFAMGRGRKGTVPVLRELGSGLGFGVEAVPALEVGGEVVSSTRVRGLLAGGDLEGVRRTLGRDYSLSGGVVPGDGRGRQLGYPTANLEVSPRKIRPARGVYAVRVEGIGEETRLGVANLGIRPTFGDGSETIEVHILDHSGDLVGKRLRVAFVERLRPEFKFNDVKELTDRIGKDVAAARALFRGAPGTAIDP